MNPDKILGQAISQYARTGSGATTAPTESFKGKRPELKSNYDKGGAIQEFASFFGKVGSQTGSLAYGAAKGLGGFVVDSTITSAKAIYDTSDKITKGLMGQYSDDLDQSNLLVEEASRMFAQATKAYRAGKLDKEGYNQALADYNDTLKQSNETINRTSKSIDKTDFLKDAAITLSAMLSFGRLTPTAIGNTKLASAALVGGKKTGAVFDAANKLEDVIMKIPSAKAILVKNGGTAASRGVVDQGVRDALVGIMLKQPFVYHATIDDVSALAQDLSSGAYGKAAARAGFLASLPFAGGLFGRSIEGAQQVGGASKKALFGVGSTMDEMGTRLKEADPTAFHQLLNGLKTGSYKAGQKLSRSEREAIRGLQSVGADEVEKTLRLFNEQMLRATGDDVFEVGERIAEDNIKRLGRKLNEVSAAEWAWQNFKYQRAAQRLVDLAESGRLKDIDPKDARKLALAVFDANSKKQFLKSMKPLESKTERLMFIDEALRSGKAPHWLQNKDMQEAIIKMVNKTENYDDLVKRVNNMTSAVTLKNVPTKIAKEFAKEGYVITTPIRRESPFVRLDEARQLTSQFGESMNWDPSFAPNKTLRVVGGGLRKMGLSPEETSRVAYKQLRDNVDTAFKDLDIGLQADDILKQLRNHAETTKLFKFGRNGAVTDLRMIRRSEIMKVLNVDKAQAKQVMNALHQAHLQIPLQLRGLGDRVVDKMYKYLPWYKYQARVQSGARYAYNPFFRLQENVETELLGQLTGGGKVPSFPVLDDIAERLFPNYYDKLDDATNQLKGAGIFSETFSGAGADDVVLGRITANMTKSQQRSLAGLALKIADKKGKPLKTLLAQDPDVIEDALRIIVQYPKKGALNSPLIKTLNLAVFPTRYNLKVAGIAAKEIAKLPPVLQVAMLNSFMDFPDWLKTEEGIAWRQEHYEAIQLMKWLTPVGSLEALGKAAGMATGQSDFAPSDLGQLGGLPIGIFLQVLDGQGIIDMNTPYVDISSGDVYSRELPDSAKGRIYLATMDLLNQMFTYPGRTLGLPGKRALLRDVSGGLVGVDRGKDTKYVDQEPYLTEEQKALIEMIRKDKQNSGEPDITTSYYTIPIMSQLELDREGQPILPKSQRPERSRSGRGTTVADPSPLGL